MSPMLNLADADTSGFGGIPGGTYDAVIFAAKMEATKGPTEHNPNPKLPKDTPMVNVQFKIIGGNDPETGEYVFGDDFKYFNRRAFRTFIIPPEKIAGKKYEHAARMKGILVRFLQACGFSDEELAGEEFDLQPEELAGRPVRVVLSRKVKFGLDPEDPDFNSEDDENFDNEVTGVKPPSEVGAGASGLT